jgi:hypothetical protein
MTAPVPRRPMTDAEVALARALARCSFPVASWSKRFARELGAAAAAPQPTITEKQAAAMRRLVSTYRRQIAPASIPEAERHLLTDAAARAARAARQGPEHVSEAVGRALAGVLERAKPEGEA